MLKNIDTRLNADVLYALQAMGHGDELIISDANFPADTIARQSRLGHLLRIDTATTADAVEAVLTVLPLDTFVEHTAHRMEMVDDPHKIPPVQSEVQKVIDAAEDRPFPMGSIERFAFYERAKQAYCVIQTGERRFYGCIVITKGVIEPGA